MCWWSAPALPRRRERDGVELRRALAVADRVYLLGRGRVTFSGAPSELDEAELMRRYVGGEGLQGWLHTASFDGRG